MRQIFYYIRNKRKYILYSVGLFGNRNKWVRTMTLCSPIDQPSKKVARLILRSRYDNRNKILKRKRFINYLTDGEGWLVDAAHDWNKESMEKLKGLHCMKINKNPEITSFEKKLIEG